MSSSLDSRGVEFSAEQSQHAAMLQQVHSPTSQKPKDSQTHSEERQAHVPPLNTLRLEWIPQPFRKRQSRKGFMDFNPSCTSKMIACAICVLYMLCIRVRVQGKKLSPLVGAVHWTGTSKSGVDTPGGLDTSTLSPTRLLQTLRSCPAHDGCSPDSP